MYVRQASVPSCGAAKKLFIEDTSSSYIRAPRKSAEGVMSPRPVHGYENLEKARVSSTSETRKRISLGTTNKALFGAMGAFDKQEVEQNRVLAMSQINMNQGKQETNENDIQKSLYTPLVHGNPEL
jgi:hypothetical protein